MSTPAPRVLCVGDIDVDFLVDVPALPQLDEKVSGRRRAVLPGGMAANVAVGLARLGTRARLVGAVGDDDAGRSALAAIAGEGVDVSHVVQRLDCNTFMCLVMLTPVGEKALVRLATDAYLPKPADAPDAVFEDVDHLHLTLGDPALTLHCIERARRRGIPVSLDLEVADLPADDAVLREVLHGVDLLFVNQRGHAALAGRIGEHGGDWPATVVTTLGSAGSRVSSQGQSIEVPGLTVTARDTTGAGDCFAAAFLERRLRGHSPAEALTFANTAAALSTLEYGAQAGLPTARQVLDALAPSSGA